MTQSNTDHDHQNHTPDGPQKSSIVPDEIARAPIRNTLIVSDKPDHDKVSVSETDDDSNQNTITSSDITVSTSYCCDTTTSTSTTSTEEFTKQPTKCTFTQVCEILI